MTKLTYALILVLLLVGLAQLALHIQWLPEKVASHFNGAGEADGDMSRTSYALMNLAMIVGMPILLLGAAKLSHVLPESMINMPNKEYWLHPDRKAGSLKILDLSLAWITAATQLFLMSIAQLVFWANVQNQNLAMVPFAVAMGLYLLIILGICVYIFAKFRLPADVSTKTKTA